MIVARWQVRAIMLALACGCGGGANGSARPDGGLGRDAHATTYIDGAGGTDRDGAQVGEAGSADGLASGCDSGSTSSRCLAKAGAATVGQSLAVDDTNVYWSAAAVDGTLGYIAGMPLGGGAAVTLADSATLSMASDGADLYLAEEHAGTAGESAIARVPVGGGAVTTLAGADAAMCVTLDESNVYWTDFESVLSVPKGGGVTTTLAQNASSFALVTDATNVYWIDGFSKDEASIVSVPKAGGDAQTLLIAPSAALSYGCRALAVVGETLYFPYEDHVASVPVAGAATPTFLVDAGAPYALVAGATHLFWLGIGSRIEVDEAPLDGGAVTTLATPLAHTVSDIALSPSGTLFWATDMQIQSLRP